jgi:hypothetical protein
LSIFSKKSEPLLVNNVNRIKPLINTMPELSALNLNQTLNTEVVCRVCRGKRVVYIRNQEVGTIQISHCIHCNGSGVMSNRE